MNKEQELIERAKKLSKLIDKLDKEIPTYPQGALRIAGKKTYNQYYLVTQKGDTKGRYIKSGDKTAEQLAQRDYLIKLKEASQRELLGIRTYLASVADCLPEDVYEGLNEYRKQLVKPVLISNEEYARRWQQEEFVGNSMRSEEKVYETKAGEKVRSKSEVLIADMYFEMGIPYRYECELCLDNGVCKYPDFTLLHKSTRRIFYHEHFGLLEDPLYLQKNLIKLNEYAHNNILPGYNLIITYETSYAPINIKEVKRIINRMFAE